MIIFKDLDYEALRIQVPKHAKTSCEVCGVWMA